MTKFEIWAATEFLLLMFITTVYFVNQSIGFAGAKTIWMAGFILMMALMLLPLKEVLTFDLKSA